MSYLHFVRPSRLSLIGVLLLLTACTTSAPTPPLLAKEIVLYNWADYMPQAVLDAFAREYGVTVTYQTYETQEEAVVNLQAGKVYDIVVLENPRLPALIAAGLLAEIDYHQIPNFKNISPNFRDLAYDPSNLHSIPFHWGTTGLVVRSDLIGRPITRWADLWDVKYRGKLALWQQPREVTSMALKSLGYSANSEKPVELAAAADRLRALRPNVELLGGGETTSVPALNDGRAVVAMGWAFDALAGMEQNPAIQYVLPTEGSLLWGDNLVIPANSLHRYTAEIFLNFLLRPEISAQIINDSLYAMPNDAARPFIDPEVLNNPIIFPPETALAQAEILMPLSPAGQQRYDDIWTRFLSDRP